MTATQISRQLARFNTVVVAWSDLAALQEAARLASEQLPVKWTFEPGTPSTVIDYLAGGAQGALKGAAIGVGVEVVLAVLFPAATLGYALVGGAVLGAVHGAARVHQGWRLRLLYVGGSEPLLDVARVA